MKKFILCIGLLITFYEGYTQSAPVRMTLSRRDKPISMRVDMIATDIEGYDGDELIITPVPDSAQTPLAAKGLKQMPMSRQEATDRYPKITDNGEGISINIPPGYARKILIKVPQECLVHVVSMSYVKDVYVKINNVAVVELFAIIPLIHLNKVSSFIISSGGAASGLPASDRIILSDMRFDVKSLSSNGKPRQPVFAASGNSATIELYLPEDIKADIFSLSRNGTVYSELMTPAADKLSENGISFWKSHFSTDDLPLVKQQTINGGGVQIGVDTNYGNILIKKQK